MLRLKNALFYNPYSNVLKIVIKHGLLLVAISINSNVCGILSHYVSIPVLWSLWGTDSGGNDCQENNNL